MSISGGLKKWRGSEACLRERELRARLKANMHERHSLKLLWFADLMKKKLQFIDPTFRKKAANKYHIKGPLVAAFRSPLMKALDRSVETLGL